MNDLTPTERAYIAGLIDGEGCIWAATKPNGSFAAVLAVNMIHRPTIEWLWRATGVGFVYKFASQKSRSIPRRQLWRWAATNAVGAEVLEAVLPYMVTKSLQAEAYISLMKLRARTKHSGLRSKRDIAGTEHDDLVNMIKYDKKMSFD